MKLLRYFNPLFIFLILLENFFLFYTHTKGLGQTKNAISYFLVSLAIGILILVKFYNKKTELSVSKFNSGKWNYLILFVLLIPTFIIGIGLSSLFKTIPINAKSSDIIPFIQVMMKRFIEGIPVYVAPFDDFGYRAYPTYLPLQWLPFVIAEKMHFDYRWIAFAAWSISIAVLLRRTVQSSETWIKICAPVLLYGTLLLILTYEQAAIAHTVELLIAAYYMLLIAGINQKSIYANAVVIILCLLSRYSLVLWLPLYAFVLFAAGHKKALLHIAIISALLIIVIYVIPFLSQDWGSFYRGYKYYDGAALGEWGNLNPDGFPYHLYNGTGFAHMFYDKLEHLDMMQRIKILQRVHFILSVGICIIMGIWYWFNRKKIDYRIFLMASFKIYFTVFLAFIQVPYIYLMTVANFVSIAIFVEQMRYRRLQIH